MLAGYLQHGPACLRKKPDPGLPMLRIVTLMGVGERTLADAPAATAGRPAPTTEGA